MRGGIANIKQGKVKKGKIYGHEIFPAGMRVDVGTIQLRLFSNFLELSRNGSFRRVFSIITGIMISFLG